MFAKVDKDIGNRISTKLNELEGSVDHVKISNVIPGN